MELIIRTAIPSPPASSRLIWKTPLPPAGFSFLALDSGTRVPGGCSRLFQRETNRRGAKATPIERFTHGRRLQHSRSYNKRELPTSRDNHGAAQEILARSCQRAPVCSHQSSADGNTAHGDSGSPAQDERTGEYDRGLCNGEQRDTEQDVLQPGYENIMDQIYAIGIL
jgi:hypothetical protein